jgi:hypothetical protein
VWNRVAEKTPAEEISDAMRPFHDESCHEFQNLSGGKSR